MNWLDRMAMLLPVAVMSIVITLGLMGSGGPLPSVAAITIRLDDDDDDRGPQGIPTTFMTADKSWHGGPDVRLSRLVALYVPEGQSPTPFLPPGPFTAVFDGKLLLDFASEFTLSAEGRGKVTISINGETVFESAGEDFRTSTGKTIRLKKENALLVKYESPATGDAILRLFWESTDMRRETLHWKNLRYSPEYKPLAVAKQLRDGRELLGTHRCLKCHAADTDAWVKNGGMPELAMDGPALDDIGARLKSAWLARWIHDPAVLRPNATMPRLLAGADKPDQRAIDMAAYLTSLGGRATKDEKPPDEETLIAGTRLFAHLGCISCHLPPSQDNFEDDKKRIPLRDISAKWQPAALRAFLRQPEQHFHWIRMPNFNLSEAEAGRLSAYLLNVEARDIFVEPGKADIANGKRLVQATGCLNCHAIKGESSSLKAPAFADWKGDRLTHGCLDENANRRRQAPHFHFTPDQHNALRAFAADTRASLTREAAPEFAARQISLLRCNACHKRGEQLDYWTQLRDEEMGIVAALPMLDPEKEPKQFVADQSRPTLTWAGEKLKPEWLTALFAGKLDYKPRLYLRARMPAFPQRADMLAQGLVFEHGCPPKSPVDAKADAKLAEIGATLASKSRWNCASCHDVGKSAAVGVFEAPGPNFMHVKERIRPEYFERWLWNPLRVEPGTKMPMPYFWKQPSQIRDILGGDSSKQIEAMWNYLLLGNQIKPPLE